MVQDGQTVDAGDVLVKIPRETAKQKDITGGPIRFADGQWGRGSWHVGLGLGRLYFEGPPKYATTDTGKDLIVSSFTPAFEQDLAQATKWLQTAARQGHAEATQLLGTGKGQGDSLAQHRIRGSSSLRSSRRRRLVAYASR